MEDNGLFLVFTEEVGKDTDGNYIYDFMFSSTPEAVWGDYWNIVPAGICGRILPEESTISKKYRVLAPTHYVTAQKNTCFSMQDVIDGVLALFWTDLNGLEEYPQEGRMVLRFGDDFIKVGEELGKRGLSLTEENQQEM